MTLWIEITEYWFIHIHVHAMTTKVIVICSISRTTAVIHCWLNLINFHLKSRIPWLSAHKNTFKALDYNNYLLIILLTMIMSLLIISTALYTCTSVLHMFYNMYIDTLSMHWDIFNFQLKITFLQTKLYIKHEYKLLETWE